MSSKNVYLGNNIYNKAKTEIEGGFVEIGGEQFYKISNYNQMDDFFISIISNSDHWMFISSNGALTAGRKNRDNALFPYYTEDKIHDYKGINGAITYLIIELEGKDFLWEPFSDEHKHIYSIERNIYKSFYGNKIIFEEINHDLQINFKYAWYNSDKFGFIKKSCITNLSDSTRKFTILDGLKNILPSGTDYNFQNEYSNLLDAYKKNELIPESGIGLFTLSSIPVDRAEPSESLLATTVWSVGFKNPTILLCNDQIDRFKQGEPIKTELDKRAKRGAYLVNSEMNLGKNDEKEWFLIADVNQDSADVANLNQLVQKAEDLKQQILDDVEAGTEKLKRIASNADGIQKSGTELCYARHYSNTLYNVMRGGIFANNYQIDKTDFINYLHQINKLIAKEQADWIEQLPQSLHHNDLIDLAEDTGNADLIRITYEYLPLTFSRRHGDPSRPWNIFSIETKNDDGSIKYNYEGNWRDIFQNWEALCYSYPEFIEGIISKFVNASTIDGYNPYRIMRSGIEWECPDPDDPWAYIGYWGDHQIIYLQKLIELSDQFHPGKLEKMLVKEIFTYANVPYQIKPYDDILKNPKDTIVFNAELNSLINAMHETIGADSKLVKSWDIDKPYKVNLMEKILVPLLSKLCNFIPEAGIWLNTQRPEWNDANNALVGNGTSMVTLYYLRRFLKFWENKISQVEISEFSISNDVLVLFENVNAIFNENQNLLSKDITDIDRRKITDLLGIAHSNYRSKIYTKSFKGRKRNLTRGSLLEFIKLSLKYIDHSIKKNKRHDGLYHAYNLITLKKDEISIRHLYEMLEGQVAVLSSGLLKAKESLEILDALKQSEMFRDDQYSYMLYPDRQLKRFTDKNKIPKNKVIESQLLSKLINDRDDSVIKSDQLGNYYFNKDLRNKDILKKKLDALRNSEYAYFVDEEQDKVLEIYEQLFDHQSFTGRSGTFYGYEGLGSIYWHMVSKLLLAVQECFFNALREGAEDKLMERFKNHYYEIKAGIGLYKSPELYGAFPTDAYSHTPGNAGVKQPGLTGQVKEDVISRFGELGVQIKNGKLTFDLSLINLNEILMHDSEFGFYDIHGKWQVIQLNKGQIALSFCQVPIILSQSNKNSIHLISHDNSILTVQGTEINNEISKQIFKRTGEIKRIEVLFSKS